MTRHPSVNLGCGPGGCGCSCKGAACGLGGLDDGAGIRYPAMARAVCDYVAAKGAAGQSFWISPTINSDALARSGGMGASAAAPSLADQIGAFVNRIGDTLNSIPFSAGIETGGIMTTQPGGASPTSVGTPPATNPDFINQMIATGQWANFDTTPGAGSATIPVDLVPSLSAAAQRDILGVKPIAWLAIGGAVLLVAMLAGGGRRRRSR